MSDLNFNTYKGASYAGIWRNEGTNQTGTSNAPATADNGYLFVFAYGSQTKTVHIWVGIYKGVIQGDFTMVRVGLRGYILANYSKDN